MIEAVRRPEGAKDAANGAGLLPPVPAGNAYAPNADIRKTMSWGSRAISKSVQNAKQQ